MNLNNEGGDDMLESFGYKAEEIRMQLLNIRENIRTASNIHQTIYQRMLASFHMASNCFINVNFWSAIHILVLIFIGLFQIFVTRSLFDDNINLVKKVLLRK